MWLFKRKRLNKTNSMNSSLHSINEMAKILESLSSLCGYEIKNDIDELRDKVKYLTPSPLESVRKEDLKILDAIKHLQGVALAKRASFDDKVKAIKYVLRAIMERNNKL